MYYTIKNDDILIANNKQALTRFYDNVLPLPEDYEVGKYIVENNQLVLNANFEAEQQAKEVERIAKLYLTGADVERGIYQAINMDFDDIINMVETLKQEQGDAFPIDIKALKIELKANHFYRGNPYVNAVGALLGFTSEMLDKFFEFNDYTYLISSGSDEPIDGSDTVVVTDSETPSDEAEGGVA